MTHLRTLLMSAALALPWAAGAEQPAPPPEAAELMKDALEKQAALPAQPPTLPDPASVHARDALKSKAFRRTGEVRRRLGVALHEAAAPGSARHAEDTRRPRVTATTAAQEAAGRQRASEARAHASEHPGPPIEPPRR